MSSPHCKLAAAVIAEEVHSEKLWCPPMKKMIPDVMIQSEMACSQFPSAYTTRAYALRLSCDHAGSDPSQHKVKLGYAQTYLDDKRLAMDIHF